MTFRLRWYYIHFMNANIKETKSIPRIGMRIIKSAIGVFICMLINYFRGNSGIVFYSLIAVLWCVRDYVSETKTFAIQRTTGTIIGALYGLVFLLITRHFSFNLNNSVIYGLVVAVMIVIVLYTTVLLKQKQASYFSCVVLLSIIINHASDINPFLFVFNRFLDTMIGIVVGICVNCFSIHIYRKKDILFLSGLDDTIITPGGEISPYSRVELNRMIERGVHFTVSTIRTPASLIEPLKGINLSLPVISMDGAALYNITDNSYEKVYIISNEHSTKIQKYLNENGYDYFANVILEDVLLIYYMDSENENYNKLIQSMRKSPYRNYLKTNGPVDSSIVYFMMIDRTDKQEKIYEQLRNEELFRDFKITIAKSSNMEDCSLIKIYNKNATKENMLDYLKDKYEIANTVTFGTLEGKYTYTILPGDFDRVVKLMKRELGKTK